MLKHKIFTVLIPLITVNLFAQIPNAQFTDLKGKTYDLYDLFSKGKYIVVHTQYSS